ncbi:winged helix-turn-helix domain-containing protein [Isorropodon fossajaponicum symbiont]|uniref:winged helix-turn-helix domain-containing protein n=1 Tax=Isorropodon fossajaponicum symbiont TaxID=883811 RepID=UPI001915F8D2
MRGDTVEIGATEFRLLYFLMKNKGRVFSRSQLLDEVWGKLTVIDERTIDVHILRLRKILKRYQLESCVQTVRSIGCRFN